MANLEALQKLETEDAKKVSESIDYIFYKCSI